MSQTTNGTNFDIGLLSPSLYVGADVLIGKIVATEEDIIAQGPVCTQIL